MPTRPHTSAKLEEHANSLAEAFRSWLYESDCVERQFQELVASLENVEGRLMDEEDVEALRQRLQRIVDRKIRLVLRTGDWRE